jgi:hypothetical protein
MNWRRVCIRIAKKEAAVNSARRGGMKGSLSRRPPEKLPGSGYLDVGVSEALSMTMPL